MSNLSIEHKKGEVNELKASLRNPAVERDPEKRREVVKRVIAYMTLGIDVSRLFTEMIMATSSKDLVVKKMVYLYIVNYASTNPELSLLAINTFQKDCRDEDPITRGLALRSFCSLRLPNIVEYLQKPVEDGLADPSSYVRRTAAMGCAKLHNLAPALSEQSGLAAKVRAALFDRDTAVIGAAICALEEMEGRAGPVPKELVHHLLNRIREFSEWAQVCVLGLVGRYVPAETSETFDIMNLLEERLRHSNAAVVLATTKVFLNLTQDFPDVHRQVLTRLRAPLVTLVHGGSVEQGYATLEHIALLAQRAPSVFAEEHRLFFARYHEPSYVKRAKLRILTAIATPRNVAEIVEEVSEYATDVDVAVSRAAVAAMGSLGASLGCATRAVADGLVALLEIGIPHVSSAAVVAIQVLLRAQPQLLAPTAAGGGENGGNGAAPAPLALAICAAARNTLDEPEARCALLWMLGQFGESLPEAPYLLEPLADEFGEEGSAAVRLELLAAAVKLLLKRPAEVRGMAGRLLAAAVADTRFTEVHDRAILYYRLLQHGADAASRVLVAPAGTPAPGAGFTEDGASEWQDKLFEEFNTLAVIYGLPPDRFLNPELSVNAEARKLSAARAAGGARPAAAAGGGPGGGAAAAEEEEGEEEEEDEDEDEMDDEDEEDEEGAAEPQAPPVVDLLGDLDLSPQPPLALTPSVSLDSASFQAQWSSIGGSSSWTLPFASTPASQPVVSALAASHVKCIAFGSVGASSQKYYFYAKAAHAHAGEAAGVFLVELVLDMSARLATATFKSAAAGALPAFMSRLKTLVHAAVP